MEYTSSPPSSCHKVKRPSTYSSGRTSKNMLSEHSGATILCDTIRGSMYCYIVSEWHWMYRSHSQTPITLRNGVWEWDSVCACFLTRHSIGWLELLITCDMYTCGVTPAGICLAWNGIGSCSRECFRHTCFRHSSISATMSKNYLPIVHWCIWSTHYQWGGLCEDVCLCALGVRVVHVGYVCLNVSLEKCCMV